MDIEARLAAMEMKLRLLEDRAEIFQLMASYGPAVDSLSAAPLVSLWQPDGVYRSDALVFEGQDGVAGLLRSEFHQQVVKAGSAHIVSLPHLDIEADRAVATGYSLLVVCQEENHRIIRASANRWEFIRSPQGWRVEARTNRRLNGDEQARALLGQMFSAF